MGTVALDRAAIEAGEMGLWVEHRVFDLRSALGKGPIVDDVETPCLGTLYYDRHGYEAGDPYVIVECDHCDYAVGVPRGLIAGRMDEVVPDGEGELRWYQR